MEGFHLFQERIKGEAHDIQFNDSLIVFNQKESLSGWDLSECPLFNEDEEITSSLCGSFADFAIECHPISQGLQLSIDPPISNFSNDLESEGRKTIFMFYE